MVEVSSPGYVEVNIRKCDHSSPTFIYTEDCADFVNGRFDSERVLSDGPHFKEIVKITKADSLYLTFLAN